MCVLYIYIYALLQIHMDPENKPSVESHLPPVGPSSETWRPRAMSGRSQKFIK